MKKEESNLSLVDDGGAVIQAAPADAGDADMYVEFSKPYMFEDVEYKGIDLSPMLDMSARDMVAAQKQLERGGTISALPEMTMEYAVIFAARATKMPMEFYYDLPPREAMKVKNKVTGFFYGSD